MAMYLKWHMCPCHEPLVAQISICSNSIYSFLYSLFVYIFVCLLGFVGLVNQAMTCYLNSLLQTLYMSPEFRNSIYRY